MRVGGKMRGFGKYVGRAMKRRRFLIVVLIAAFVGFLLPYVQVVFTVPRWNVVSVNGPIMMWSEIGYQHAQGSDHLYVPLKLSEENVAEIARRSGGLMSPEWLKARGPFHEVVFERFGWPFHALYMRQWVDEKGLTHFDESGTLIEYGGWPATVSPTMMPSGVIWPGLFGNALVSICVTLAVYVLFAYLRAAWKRWLSYRLQGVCANCRYEVGDLAVCPECGQAVEGAVDTGATK